LALPAETATATALPGCRQQRANKQTNKQRNNATTNQRN